MLISAAQRAMQIGAPALARHAIGGIPNDR